MPSHVRGMGMAYSVRLKALEAGGHRATGYSKAGGPTENPAAQIIFFS